MKPTLNEQLIRMQKLAGIIKENQGSNTNMLDFSSWKRIMGDDNIYAMVPPSKKADEGLDIWVYPAKNKVMIASNDDNMIQTIADKYNSEVYQEMAPSIYQVNLKLADLASLFPGQDFFLDDMNEGKSEDYYKDAEKDDAAHIDALEKDMKDDAKKTSEAKMTKSDLKAKIKEMILAELTEDSDEDINITNDSGDYDPLAENNPDEDEDDVNIDDYDENYSDGYIDDYDTEYDLGIDEAKDYNAQSLYNMFKKEDLLNDRREYDVEDLMNSYPGLSQEEAEKLEDMLQNPLDEAKKDEEVEDVTVDDTEVVDAPASDMMAGESAEISGIQSNLQSAYAEAKALGDEKLITQIANTITYFTKAHILDTAPINENITNDEAIYDILSNMDNEDIINDMFTAIQQNPSMKLEDFLNQYDGGNDLGDDNDDNYDDNMDVYDDSYPDMAEGKEMEDNRKILDQVRNKLLGLFQPYGDFQILDMTMKGQNLGTEFRLRAKSKGADWKGLENFMRNNPDFSIKNISKQTFDNPKSIDFSYKTDQINENMFPMLKRILR